MPRWSFSWVVAAMSATRKSMSPSLFTSPRSEPIEENERVRHDLVDDVGEGAVPVVVIELVGRGEIVGDVEIGPAVVVVVPPGGGMALRLAGDAGAVGHVGEGAVAVVVKKIIALAVRMAALFEQVGLDVDIEPAVAVVVAEAAMPRRP